MLDNRLYRSSSSRAQPAIVNPKASTNSAPEMSSTTRGLGAFLGTNPLTRLNMIWPIFLSRYLAAYYTKQELLVCFWVDPTAWQRDILPRAPSACTDLSLGRYVCVCWDAPSMSSREWTPLLSSRNRDHRVTPAKVEAHRLISNWREEREEATIRFSMASSVT